MFISDKGARKPSCASSIGLGNMGMSMATNLLQFLSQVSAEERFEPMLHVYNRTQSKADKLVSQGAILAPSISGKLPAMHSAAGHPCRLHVRQHLH